MNIHKVIIRFINITKEAYMKRINKKDNEIELIKEIEKLNKKVDYYQKLDSKNMLSICKMQRVINDYENSHIAYYKYDELQNDYWQLQNCYNLIMKKIKFYETNYTKLSENEEVVSLVIKNNKNKGASNE